MNHKRVERIWRQEGLKVPKKQPRRGQAVVERWVMPSVKTVLAGSCLGVRFCGRSNPRWSSTEDLDGGG